MSTWSRWLAFRLAILIACGCHGAAQEQEATAALAALSGDDGGTVDPDAGPTCVPTSQTDGCDHLDNDCDGAIDEDCPYGPSQCPGGSNVIEGSDGDDLLIGTKYDDCILGYAGDDELWGMDGNDTLLGGPGDDSLIGHQGDDTLLGGDGNDELLGGAGFDRLEGEAGNDFLEGGEGQDALEGGACNDRLLDAQGPDQLSGGPGSDRLVHGDPSSATIAGGDGVDACEGNECEQPSSSFRCHEDADCPAGMGCTAGSHFCVDATALIDGSCDGADDDCDGHTDEDFTSSPTTCGLGLCVSSGQTQCTGGTVSDSCTPGTPGASDDSCNALDDDCDGQADEGYPVLATSCGIGACSRTGVNACSAGQVHDTCVPGAPAVGDACNGIDDDCDGNTDEDFQAAATNCGVGACSSTGVTSCSGGSVHNSCVAGTPAADDATCNAIDDDCNGASDEDFVSQPTVCEVLGCFATGSTSCNAGSVIDSCPITPVCVVESDCGDAIDNDGDARTDCVDVDCAGTPACAPQALSVNVIGTANIWGAGHAAPPVAGTLPPISALQFTTGATLTVSSVTGTVHATGGPALGPDGLAAMWTTPSTGGIAGYIHQTLARSLVGVFLGSAEPADPAPARLTFANGNFTTLAPAIGQIFFIGDGHTASNELQQFQVPAGATRLSLGITDMCNDGGTGAIGCFNDNTGAFQVTAQIAPPPPVP